MKKLKLGIFILALVLVLTTLVSACSTSTPTSPETPTQPKELKIGLSTELTGPMSEAYIPYYRGILAAADWINDGGGLTINGEKYLITIVAEDNGATAEGSVEVANKLVYDHNVKFILSTALSPFVPGEVNVTEEAGVLYEFNCATGLPTDLGPDKPLTFAGSVLYETLPGCLDYLLDTYPQVTKFAFVYPEDPSLVWLTDNVMKPEVESRGMTLVAAESYPLGTVDFYPVLTKVIAAGPDAMECMGMATWLGGMLKQGRELGFTGPIFSHTDVTDPVVVRDVATTALATDAFVGTPYVESPMMPAMVQEIAGIMSDKFQEELREEHIRGWEMLWVLAQAIEKAQSLDPTQVAKAFETLESINTPFGTGKMGGLQTFGVNHVVLAPQAISSIINGEVEQVKWFVPDIP
jgi:branched-chain amino acid transport system substrate-binding protein